MNFKPMLAASLDGVDLSTIRLPLVISPKLDGVRCIVWEGVAYSRNAKPIRNQFVQKWASNHHNIDGELIVGEPTDPLCLNTTQSGVMSIAGEPDFYFALFDSPVGHAPGFYDRFTHVAGEHEGMPRIRVVPHVICETLDMLLAAERSWLSMGYEGLMGRAPDGPYKHGRSTLREGWLLKLKRFQDGEAVVVRLEEGKVNKNELQRDELGRAKRTSHQENLVPSGMVGTLICTVPDHPEWGEIRVAPGTMDHQYRRIHMAEAGRNLIGKTIHWRSFGYGVKDAPRFARFYGVREDL